MRKLTSETAFSQAKGSMTGCLSASIALALCCVATPAAGELQSSLNAETQQLAGKISALEEQLQALRMELHRIGRTSDAARQPAQDSSAIESLTERISIFGDYRLRYEHTSSHAGSDTRNRGVLRARVGMEYAVDERIRVGGRVTTGDSGDPNSSDITLGDFVDDLEVSMDQAYIVYKLGRNLVQGGKFANPFDKRDLVWDGDVNPAGVAARFNLVESTYWSADLTGLYFIIDEQVDLADSDMVGAQFTLRSELNDAWQSSLSAAYYDYSIGSLINANGGDIRDNNLTEDGLDYLSDFEIIDIIVALQYSGLGANWPVTISGDFVHNRGAKVSGDSGYQFDLGIGKSQRPGDWKLSYSYALNETDAVLTAFSHDNTTYASNYRQHTLAIDYVPVEDLVLNLTGYFYRRDQFELGYTDDWDQIVSRIRMNVSFSF